MNLVYLFISLKRPGKEVWMKKEDDGGVSAGHQEAQRKTAAEKRD